MTYNTAAWDCIGVCDGKVNKHEVALNGQRERFLGHLKTGLVCALLY